MAKPIDLKELVLQTGFLSGIAAINDCSATGMNDAQVSAAMLLRAIRTDPIAFLEGFRRPCNIMVESADALNGKLALIQALDATKRDFEDLEDIAHEPLES